MLLAIELPRLHELMTTGVVTAVHAAPGTMLAPGTPLVDVRVDLSDAAAQDCPPVSWFRVVCGERCVLRALNAAEGSEFAPGARLGLASTAADEAATGDPARPARLTIVGIVGPEIEW